MADDDRKVAVVTGASRGAGKGIAVGLGGLGYTVYVTGRSREEGDAPLPGTVFRSASEVDAAGGRGVAAVCDHRDDAQIASLFERVRDEAGRLDVLVNNASAIHDDLIRPGGFWEKELGVADIIDVGLRSAFVASYYAAPLMVAAGDGLIVNTSSYGAVCYMHHPAYGAQKAGVDKLAWDMAMDLAPHGVAAASIWMGPLLTERTQKVWAENPGLHEEFKDKVETPGFIGRLIDRLYRDPARADRSGQTLIAAELAREYGMTDEGGREPPTYRDWLGAPLIFSRAVVD